MTDYDQGRVAAENQSRVKDAGSRLSPEQRAWLESLRDVAYDCGLDFEDIDPDHVADQGFLEAVAWWPEQPEGVRPTWDDHIGELARLWTAMAPELDGDVWMDPGKVQEHMIGEGIWPDPDEVEGA